MDPVYLNIPFQCIESMGVQYTLAKMDSRIIHFWSIVESISLTLGSQSRSILGLVSLISILSFSLIPFFRYVAQYSDPSARFLNFFSRFSDFFCSILRFPLLDSRISFARFSDSLCSILVFPLLVFPFLNSRFYLLDVQEAISSSQYRSCVVDHGLFAYCK